MRQYEKRVWICTWNSKNSFDNWMNSLYVNSVFFQAFTDKMKLCWIHELPEEKKIHIESSSRCFTFFYCLLLCSGFWRKNFNRNEITFILTNHINISIFTFAVQLHEFVIFIFIQFSMCFEFTVIYMCTV